MMSNEIKTKPQGIEAVDGPTIAEPCCGNCAYYLAMDNEGNGFCRRYPPVPLPIMKLVPPKIQGAMPEQVLNIQPTYPPTQEQQYCGEYESSVESFMVREDTGSLE